MSATKGMEKPFVLNHMLFGAAYYDEYMPRDLDRVDQDMDMMRHIGINVIRIAESTWSTCEPQPGAFDFSHVDRVLDAARRHSISVIVGTPTYAVPAWLVRMHPDVLAVTPDGPGKYGARQIMDIVNPSYLYYAERIIRKLIGHVCHNPAVIGYQVDNETKYYDCVSPDMQALFVKYLQDEFHGNLEAMNEAFGLDYWSNRIDSWEDFPNVSGSINESLREEFDAFRRGEVTKYLAWQADIVRQYARDDQFVTQNFDFEWRGYSFGVQPQVDHFKASEALDIAGVDIYHPTEDQLTGKEIAFGGDMARSMKGGANYLVLETEAQGQHGWLPYPGQLRLQAYSHLASGADGVMYWHWSSIHHSFETYWKGLLSHDFEPNPTYEEAGVFGREIANQQLQRHVMHLHKRNKVAIMVSNKSLDALDWFHMETGFPDGGSVRYNDIVRTYYDALFELNVEVDFVPDDADAGRLSQYSLVVTPALYCSDEGTIAALREYVRSGGHLLSSLRSFVADEHVGVWHDRAPHMLTDVFGMSYSQFTVPHQVGIESAKDLEALHDCSAHALIELLKPDAKTQVLARYRHQAWNSYAAITRHEFAAGWAQWIGTVLDAESIRHVLREACQTAGVLPQFAQLPDSLTVRQGWNDEGEHITYLLNYGPERVSFPSPISGEVIVGGIAVQPDGSAVDHECAGPKVGTALACGQDVTIGPWNLAVVVSKSGDE